MGFGPAGSLQCLRVCTSWLCRLKAVCSGQICWKKESLSHLMLIPTDATTEKHYALCKEIDLLQWRQFLVFMNL